MSIPQNPPIYPQHDSKTLLVHRTQLIADTAPNPLLVHHITQSHVQFSQRGRVPQTGRNGEAELFVAELPNATAWGASVVYCDGTCVLGLRGVLESRCGGLGC